MSESSPEGAKAKDPNRDPMWDWVLELPAQLEQARAQAHAQSWPLVQGSPRAIYLGGMGGSGLACQLALSILWPRISRPCVVRNDPEVPSWVGPDVLAGVVTYSGETWEASEMLDTCAARRAELFTVTSGERFLADARFSPGTAFRLPAGYAPRAALGWMLVPLLFVLAGAERESMEEELLEAVTLLREETRLWREGSGLPERVPREIAGVLADREAFLYTSGESVRSVGVRWKMALLENAKQMAHEGFFPELAHAEIMGWRFLHEPSSPSMKSDNVSSKNDVDESDFDRKERVFVFPEEPSLSEGRRQRGLRAAQAELRRLGARILQIPTRGEGRTARLLSQVALGDAVSVEVARQRGVDPTPIDAIQRVKAESEREHPV